MTKIKSFERLKSSKPSTTDSMSKIMINYSLGVMRMIDYSFVSAAHSELLVPPPCGIPTSTLLMISEDLLGYCKGSIGRTSL